MGECNDFFFMNNSKKKNYLHVVCGHDFSIDDFHT